MKNHQDGGEAILEAFRDLGVDYIISSPGSEWGSVWEALVRQKIGGKRGPIYIDCWHETIAVNMAFGYTQMTGRPQAVLLHAGPGLMQGSIGIHAAMQVEIPMLIMSGEALSYGENPEFDPGPQWYRSLSFVGGTQRLVEPIVKWATQITSIHTVYETIVRAFEMTQRAPAGPIYLNMPIETMLQDWIAPERSRKIPPAPKTRPVDVDIESVTERLLSAHRPVISTEAAGRDPESFAALVEFADLLSIPVVEGSYVAYANFPRNHPLYLGSDFKPFLDSADLVLLVRSRIPWYPPSKRPRAASIIAMSETPLKSYMVYQNLHADTYLEGDVASTLRALTAALRAKGVTSERFQARRQEMLERHNAWAAGIRAVEEKSQAKDEIDAVTLAAILRDTLPPDTIYVDETVTHRPAVARHLRWHEPQRYFYVHGGLGQGLGVALGVKLAAANQPVVLLVGDGSFLYNPIVQGLGASKGNDLPILVIVFNNRKYLAMQENHASYYPDGAAVSSDTFYGTHIDAPDYAELGRPFGQPGFRVSSPDGFRKALQAGLGAVTSGRTAIINVEMTNDGTARS